MCFVELWQSKLGSWYYLSFSHTPTPIHPHTNPYAHSPENEDYLYVTIQTRTLHYTVSYQTEDVMWLGAIQLKTSPFSVNRGYVLNSICIIFITLHPPRTEDRPRFPAGPRSPVKFHVCVLIWRWLPTHTHTHTNKQTHKQTNKQANEQNKKIYCT